MRISMLLMAVALAAVLVGDRHLLEIELSSIKDACILGGIVAGHVTRAVPQLVEPHARGDAPVEVR